MDEINWIELDQSGSVSPQWDLCEGCERDDVLAKPVKAGVTGRDDVLAKPVKAGVTGAGAVSHSQEQGQEQEFSQSKEYSMTIIMEKVSESGSSEGQEKVKFNWSPPPLLSCHIGQREVFSLHPEPPGKGPPHPGNW